MPSSTFNSDEKLQVTGQTNTRAIVILLALIALILVGLEAVTRVVVEKRSKVQQELNQEYDEAVRIRRHPESHQKQLLIIGNSLVGHGLNFSMIEQGLSPQWQVHRYWIYNTGYEDWYFGLRRVFAEGSRPDVVGITFAALHWFAPGIRGDYSAAYMFQAADIPELASELRLDRTRASGLVFARYSKFYALRSETRKAVLQSLFPDLPRMYDLFKPTASKPKPPEQVLALLKPRIQRMRDLVERNGATLVLIVPPIPRPGEEYHSELAEVARHLGIDAFMPMSCSDLPAKDFVDDMHLSSRGAALYTSRLLAVMRPALDSDHSARQIAAMQ
jgi:hypothetical protein